MAVVGWSWEGLGIRNRNHDFVKIPCLWLLGPLGQQATG